MFSILWLWDQKMLDQFKSFDVLAELDLLLNKCKQQEVDKDTINDINILLVKYVKVCSKQKVPRNLKLTQLFLK